MKQCLHVLSCRECLQRLNDSEAGFFAHLISKHLNPYAGYRPAAKPKTHANSKASDTSEELVSLRNDCLFVFVMLNSFWCVLLLTLQLLRYKLHDKIYIVIAQKEEKSGADKSLSSSSSATSTRSEYEPLSFVFICFFAAVLLIQFAAMCSHRIVTFIQVVRRTNLKLPRKMRKTLRYVHVISINDVCFNSTRLQFFGNLLDSEKDQTRRR